MCSKVEQPHVELLDQSISESPEAKHTTVGQSVWQRTQASPHSPSCISLAECANHFIYHEKASQTAARLGRAMYVFALLPFLCSCDHHILRLLSIISIYASSAKPALSHIVRLLDRPRSGHALFSPCSEEWLCAASSSSYSISRVTSTIGGKFQLTASCFAVLASLPDHHRGEQEVEDTEDDVDDGIGG